MTEERQKPQILLTNDDGIRSPGLWAAAEALSAIGFVHVAAPLNQWSGAGRSLPITSAGRILAEKVTVGGRTWDVFAVDATPAQAVQHALVELMPTLPDLIVAGINYGENVGTGVTISGTVGAALEGASFGVPGLAISLETASEYHLSHSDEVDFAAAAHFARLFGQVLLSLQRPTDVDVLKVDVPASASPATPWRITRLSRHRYYEPLRPERENLHDRARIGYARVLGERAPEPDSDVQALIDGVVSVTPLSLDLTSRVDLATLAELLSPLCGPATPPQPGENVTTGTAQAAS